MLITGVLHEVNPLRITNIIPAKKKKNTSKKKSRRAHFTHEYHKTHVLRAT